MHSEAEIVIFLKKKIIYNMYVPLYMYFLQILTQNPEKFFHALSYLSPSTHQAKLHTLELTALHLLSIFRADIFLSTLQGN